MNLFDIVSTCFVMNRRQHLAMRIACPHLFSPLLPRQSELSEVGDVWSYSGTLREIVSLLESIDGWKARPVTEERLNEILGAADGT